MAGHICPECGTDGRPGAGPGCGCAERAARHGAGQREPAGHQHVTEEQRAAEQHRIVEEHHAGRSAEFAATEDFDPLRIRPYVTLGGEETAAGRDEPERYVTDGHMGDGHTGHGHARDGQAGDGHTGNGHAGNGHAGNGHAGNGHAWEGHAGDGHAGDAATTMPLFLNPAGPAPLPDAAGPDAPNAWDGHPGTPLLTAGPDPVQPRRRRPFAALAVGAAVVAVVGTAAFIGGLFNGDGDGDTTLDPVLPSTVTSLPEESASPSASTTASASASPSRPATASPSASATASATATASPSATASASRSATAGPSGTATASSPAATADTGGPEQPVAPPAPPQDGSTLRRGDHGPEVAELQRRLQEIGLFMSPDDADYTDRVEDAVYRYQRYMYIQGDDAGVYGPHTRRALEAVTTGRGRH
ncbi:peptidoglycan-binding domain-containing protein [Streptomyces sp. NPDC048669]|uniref:peptidoglycan-binding domain-containing protein n=1 Tax=Streptomyces sp. NPDC048669 TaxID=3155267 RepID=UPI0034433B00